jgi:hypothetical protein
MDDLKRFLEESPIAERVTLPTLIIERSLNLSPEAVSGVIESGSLVPEDGATCELEIGNQRIAGGRIVKRRGAYFFKVLEMRKEERR